MIYECEGESYDKRRMTTISDFEYMDPARNRILTITTPRTIITIIPHTQKSYAKEFNWFVNF